MPNENFVHLYPPMSQPSHFLIAAKINGALLGHENDEKILRRFAEWQNGYLTLAYDTRRYYHPCWTGLSKANHDDKSSA